MKNQVNGMIRGVIDYKSDSNTYTVIDGSIYYKEEDGLSNKVNFGYRTVFSYFHEYDITKRVNLIELKKHAVAQLRVAAFSYACLPHSFETILGVSGTL
jgi:hypothetical protein